MIFNIDINVISSKNENSTVTLSLVPIEVIEHIAINKLCQLGKDALYFIDENFTVLNNNKGEPLCYYYTLKPYGYIVVSAYYELPAIIAYSFTSACPLGSSVEAQFFSVLKTDLDMRINHLCYLSEQEINERRYDLNDLLSETNKDALFEQWPPEGSTPTEGWVETTWHQNAPFNDFCPIDKNSGQRGLAGCPAVTMAQIVQYHTTINNVSFSDYDDYYHNYGGNSFWIDNDYIEYDFPSFPQLNVYLNTLSDHYINGIPVTDEDKAALTFACGVAATQVYTPSGSGTFGVDQAYDAYMKFNFSSADLVDEEDPDIYTRLANNMKNASPAHLAIVNEEWTSGHNLVVDGYNTDNYFHLNFGWGGSYDGWYLLPQELPFDLTVIEGIILDIEPLDSTIDVSQTIFDRGFPVRHADDGDWAGAQSFIPTLNNLTSAEIYMRKFGSPEFDLTVELRENHPQGTLIDTLIFTPVEVSSSWSWFELDFINFTVTPGIQYFIVCPPAPSGVTTSYGYEWGYAFGNQYDDGAFWFTRNGGVLWRDLPTTYEFTFRTHGYS